MSDRNVVSLHVFVQIKAIFWTDNRRSICRQDFAGFKIVTSCFEADTSIFTVWKALRVHERERDDNRKFSDRQKDLTELTLSSNATEVSGYY